MPLRIMRQLTFKYRIHDSQTFICGTGTYNPVYNTPILMTTPTGSTAQLMLRLPTAIARKIMLMAMCST